MQLRSFELRVEMQGYTRGRAEVAWGKYVQTASTRSFQLHNFGTIQPVEKARGSRVVDGQPFRTTVFVTGTSALSDERVKEEMHNLVKSFLLQRPGLKQIPFLVTIGPVYEYRAHVTVAL